MPEGSPLREAFKKLISQTISEVQQQSFNSDPEIGTIASLNDDGTVNVQTSTGFYGSIGAAVQFVIGSQVLVITGDGKRVAIPR